MQTEGNDDWLCSACGSRFDARTGEVSYTPTPAGDHGGDFDHTGPYPTPVHPTPEDPDGDS